MKAKLFHHDGSQAVRLPKAFRFEGTEVLIEKHGTAVVLRPIPEFHTLGDVSRYFAENYPDAANFPDPHFELGELSLVASPSQKARAPDLGVVGDATEFADAGFHFFLILR
ncbi:MAG: hypothetical protein ABIU29_12920 [Chthoniobacterales bacterium]